MADIKKAGTKIEYTPEMIREIARCKEDPVYFIKNYVKIQTRLDGMQPFNLHPYQEEMIRDFHNYRSTVCMLSRQSGKTETVASYILHYAMFNRDKNILIVAHKLDHAKDVLRRIKNQYLSIPDWAKSGVADGNYNKEHVIFENNCLIKAEATTENSGRGRPNSLIFIDELGFLNPAISAPFYSSILPSLGGTGKILITSTPNTDDDLFYNIWTGANEDLDENGVGRNGYKAIYHHWSSNPTRSQEWADEERKKMPESEWQREYECRPVSINETLIDQIFVADKLNDFAKEPILQHGNINWYKKINDRKKYLVALDPAMGTGGDYAAIQVYSIPNMEQVAEWRSNEVPIKHQVKVLKEILDYIHKEMGGMSEPDIYWTIENNSLGEAALQAIDDTGEENFPGNFMTQSKKNGRRGKGRKGYTTTHSTKMKGANKFKSLLEDGRLDISSKDLIREIKYFVASGNSYAARKGSTDDLIMATILAMVMMDDVLDWLTDEDVIDHMSESVIEEEPMPFLIC